MEAAPNKRSYIRLNAIRSLLLGIQRANSACILTDRSHGAVVDRMFNRGGIDALITKPRPGRHRKVKWSACAIYSCRCWRIPRRPARSIGPGSSSTDISRNNSRSNWATAPRCAGSMN